MSNINTLKALDYRTNYIMLEILDSKDEAGGQSRPSPPYPPLPELRVQESRPFSVTGVDYTGALSVKSSEEVKKCYIALFTCAVTRAIHLEVVEDNTMESFLCAFRRFDGRRYILGDNTRTFTSSAVVLKKIFVNETVQKEQMPEVVSGNSCLQERLICLTKNSLKKVLGLAFISLDELKTLIIEIESSLNDRHLTYASMDVNNTTALTPSKFIYGYCLGSLPEAVMDPDPGFQEPQVFTARQL